MSDNLHDIRILVTRPKPQGEELCAKIEELGGKPIYFPTIEIKPIHNPDLFHQYIESLAEYEWIIFISPQSVLHSVPWVRQQPNKTKLAAIGAGTAHALQTAGFTNITHPTDEWTSEGLLKLPCFQAVSGKKIMLVRGAGGREFLAETLALRGALVTHWIVYERVLPVSQSTIDERQIDVIVCTSGESLRNLIRILATDSHRLHYDSPVLFTIPLIVISPRLVELAHELGFKKVLLSANASHNAIIETIKGMGYVRK